MLSWHLLNLYKLHEKSVSWYSTFTGVKVAQLIGILRNHNTQYYAFSGSPSVPKGFQLRYLWIKSDECCIRWDSRVFKIQVAAASKYYSIPMYYIHVQLKRMKIWTTTSALYKRRWRALSVILTLRGGLGRNLKMAVVWRFGMLRRTTLFGEALQKISGRNNHFLAVQITETERPNDIHFNHFI